jgi:hypothetical protein
MRSSPEWFQNELTRIGGVNHYDEPIFKLVWSQEPRLVIGGRFQDGFIGYRHVPMIPGEPCWAILIWEPSSVFGSRESWEIDYRDPETQLLDAGPYPRYGRYRLLRRLMHTEIIRKESVITAWNGQKMIDQPGSSPEIIHHKMPLCGLILDLMLPMLLAWRRLSEEMKLKATRQQMQEKQDEVSRQLKDARDSIKVKRSWKLVEKRAEQLERNMEEAMIRASKWGLGIAQMEA